MRNDAAAGGPWAGLEAGHIDTRRVDAAGRWDFFWAVMPPADAALVLKLTVLPASPPELPRLRALEIRFQTLPEGPILYIRLKDGANRELFETLCRDVVAATDVAQTEAEALTRAIARTFRWHYLLRGGAAGILSEEAQKGLIGELTVLSRLIGTIGAKAALDGWTGPSGAPKDFELIADCIEVKSRRGAAQPFVKISNEFQLADVPGRRLWLAVLAVDRVEAPHGETLSDLVAQISARIQALDPARLLSFDMHLADAGFDPQHDYSAWRWLTAAPDVHAVSEGFPRITAPVPSGCSNVSYALSLAACAPFLRDWTCLSASLISEPEQ